MSTEHESSISARPFISSPHGYKKLYDRFEIEICLFASQAKLEIYLRIWLYEQKLHYINVFNYDANVTLRRHVERTFIYRYCMHLIVVGTATLATPHVAISFWYGGVVKGDSP